MGAMGVVSTVRSVVRFKPIELDPVQRRLSRSANVEDLRRIAKRRLPRGVFDYIDGAADDELTKARNTAAYADTDLVPDEIGRAHV